jgi:hypothetical protein
METTDSNVPPGSIAGCFENQLEHNTDLLLTTKRTGFGYARCEPKANAPLKARDTNSFNLVFQSSTTVVLSPSKNKPSTVIGYLLFPFFRCFLLYVRKALMSCRLKNTLHFCMRSEIVKPDEVRTIDL